jgi:hypothetical protein
MMATLAACLTIRRGTSEWKEQKWSVFENEERMEHEHTRHSLLAAFAIRFHYKPTGNCSYALP